MVDIDHEDQHDRMKKVLKILVVGDMGTGKTSLIRQYVHGFFSEFYRSTIGVDFAHKDIQWGDNLLINLQLWDISGQERFGSVTHMYYQEAVGAMIVFDVTVPQNLNVVQIWKKDIDSKVFTTEDKPIPCLLIGNKIDLVPDGWEKSKEEMEQFCQENGFIGYFETSAREAINVSEANEFLMKYIIDHDIHPMHPNELDQCIDIKNDSNKSNNGCCH